MTSFQQSIDRWSNLLDKPLAAAEPPPVDGIDITDNFGSLISEARAALTDPTAAPGSATADQDLIASAAASNQFETIMPDTSWAGLNLREVARGSQQQMSQAASVIATPSLRAEFIQSLMKPAAKIAEWLNPPKTEYELAIQNLTKRNLAQQLSMAVEPAGSGLTASPQDLQSEIIALRGTQQGLAQGQQEGFAGDVSRGIGQSLPSLAVTAGTLATGGTLLPMMLASQVTTPMSSYTNSQLAYIDDLEQRRYDQALAGETLSEFDPVEMGRRAEIGAIIETTAEAGGAAFGAKFIGKVAGRVGTSSAARFATNKFAKTGAAKAATEVVRRSGSKAGRLFTAANEGVMNFTPGFIYRGAQVAGISGFEEAGEELFAGIANSPFTYAPLGQDVNDALYSMAVASVSGGASGAASSGGLALREAVVNRNDAFRPETDRERIVRQTHSDAMKARSNWSEGLEQTQRDRIAAKLDTIEGMNPDERGTYVMALADRKAEIIANAEATLAERQEVDVAMTGAQEALDNAKDALDKSISTANNAWLRDDVYEAEFALLVLQDKAKQLDEQLVLANTDHMIATAEHGAVAEKISDMPATVVRSTPVEVLASVGTRSGVALNETKAPRWGKKIANEMEALGTQVVWYTPADKKSSNPGFHSRRTPGVIYLNAASNQQRVRAVALEEAFHDIQMFRPDIAQAFVDKAGLLPVYDAALEYVSRGGAETAAIERQDEAAFAQAENVAATLEGETSSISPNAARAGAARISQEGEANAFARAMAGIKAKGAMSSLTRLAARSGLMGRESLAAMAVVDRVARSAAIEAVSGKTGDATLSPLARTLMWASDMDVDFARDIPTADRELSEPIPAPVRPAAPAQTAQVQTGPTAETTSTVGRRLVADAIKTLGLTEEEVKATVIDLMTGLPKTKAFVANKIGKVPDVVKYIHERRLASGLRILDITKEEDQITLAKLLAAEAIGAINSAGDALQWYDKTIRNTLAQAAIKYPELETDPRARMAFILSMAITSQTMNVEDNLAFSMVQYGKYRDTVDPVTGIGQFELAGKGKNAGAQANNFRIANVMLRTLGPDQMIRFLRTKFTAGQLSNAGLNIGGELKSEEVLGSAIFGPKIGFGFYSNLDGNFDPVTMDMWFMRTIGRLTGKLPAFDQNKYDKQIVKLKASLAEKGSNGIFPSTIDQALIDDANNATDDSGLVKLARAVIKLHEKDFKDNRKDYDNKDRVQSKMVLASKAIIQSLDKPRDSPKSGGERRLLRKVVKLAVANVSEIYGEEVANAAFQAMIWYPEQELYKSHGVKLKVTSQDYSGAIRKILKNEGITDGQLDTAIATAERGSGLTRQVAGVTDTATGGLTSNVPVQTRTFSDAERASFLATTPVAIAKAWNPPAQDPNLDELQARFAGDFEAVIFTRKQRQSAYSSNWQYGRSLVGNGTKPRILKLTDESGKKSSLPYIAEIAPGDALGIVFKKAGLLSPKFVELAPVKVSAMWFNKTISAFKAEDKFGACVAAYPADDYVGMRLFIAMNGKSGFAIKPDGDVISVFAYDKHGRAILEASTAVGGKKLDAFDTVLPVIYAAHGFKATSRLKFSEQEKPEGWNYDTFKRFNNGRPDVVFMVNDPASMTRYQPTDGQLVEDYGEAVAIQEKAVSEVSFARKPRPLSSFTPQWREWFGNSKVVDEDGNPIMVFHGTWRTFADIFRTPSFFSENATEASAYAEASTFVKRQKYLTSKYKIVSAPTDIPKRIQTHSMIDDVPANEFGTIVSVGDVIVRINSKSDVEIFDDLVPGTYSFETGDVSLRRADNRKQARSYPREYREYIDQILPLGVGEGARVYPIYLSIKNPIQLAPLEANKLGKRLKSMTDKEISDYITDLEQQGYDGIETVSDQAAMDAEARKEFGGIPRQWIPFRENQIKSAFNENPTDAPEISFAREDERDAAFQKMQAERRAAQAEVMKDLSPREQALIIEAGIADYDEILDLKDKIDKLKKQIASGTPAAVEKSKRTADLQTAAQRVNALSEVRKLERRLNAMTMLAEQRLGQVNRAKARLQTQTQLAIEEQQSAAETIASLEEQITTTRDAVVAAKRSIAEERTATKEQRDALNTALANAEATAQRAINWAYAIGRNEGLVAGQVAGQQAVQTDLERGQQAEEKLKELQKSERFQKFASQRAIDWAYRIGRREGLVAGQVAGQQALKPEMTRLARVESLLDISVRRVRELKATVRSDARAAQRAVNFAYSMGLNKGRMQGIMQGRAQILAKMRKREDTLQNQLFNLRELMNTRLDDVAERNRIIRKITSEALLSIPANLRGTLANRAATATTVAQANRVAIEAIRIAINAQATEGLKLVARTAKKMNKRGMKVSARRQILTLLYEANVVLRDANNRKRQAKVVTAKGSPVTLSGAIDLYSRVLDAQTKVENATALYDTDRAEFIAERDQRIARYADLTQRLMANMAGRRVIDARARADQAARLSLISKISRANSDIYTLALELEGIEDGVIDELLRLAQEGKGEAALEHARIMRDLEPALIAAGYEGVDDYRLKNGGYGDGSTELVTVSLGGQDVTIPLGIAMSIAAMDEETLALFDGTNAGKQGIQFNETSTTLTLYPSGDDIRNLRANLTVGQRDLIERMKDILETQIRDRAMQAIWEVTGDQPPIVTRYYPRIRNQDAAGGEKVDLSAAAGAAVRGALTAVGFANARVGGSQPLIYTDMVQTMDRHMQVALDMIHMAQPYRDAITVLNDPKVVKGIDDQLGAGTASGVRSIFSNGVGATSRTKPSIIDKLTSNVTGAKLAMNPSTIAKVLVGGTIRLSSEIPLSLWTRGTARAARYARTPGTWSGRIDQIHLVNGYFSRRHQMQMKSIFSGALGDSDRAQLGNALTAVRDNLRATGNNLAAGKITDAINAAGDANRAGVMGLSAVVDMLRYADEQIMLAAVEARLAEVEDEGLLTGTDALTEASNRAERDFRKTQNASDEFDDSYFAATSRTDGNAGWRLLFPFSSDPLKARNQIRRAVLSGNRTRTAFAVGGNIVSGTTISSLSTIVTAKVISLFAGMIGAGDDEEEKKAVNKAWWENTLVSVPTQLAGDVMSVTMGYMGIMFANALSSIVYRRFLISPLIGSPAQDLVNEAKDALRKDSTTTDMMQAVIGGSLATLQYGGIPFYPLYRLVMRSLELGESAAKVQKTPREKLLDSMERKRKSLEKLRSN